MKRLSLVVVLCIAVSGTAKATLFGISSTTESLYTIDANTGATTLIGRTSFVLNVVFLIWRKSQR